MSEPTETDLLLELCRAYGVGAKAAGGLSEVTQQALSLAFELHVWAGLLTEKDDAKAELVAELAATAYQIVARARALSDALQPEQAHLAGMIEMKHRDSAGTRTPIH